MGMMDEPHVVRRWPWHPVKIIKMRDLKVGQYIGVNNNRWVRVNYITGMSDGTLMPMCGLNSGRYMSMGADAMFDMPPVHPDQEITIRG